MLGRENDFYQFTPLRSIANGAPKCGDDYDKMCFIEWKMGERLCIELDNYLTKLEML